MYDSVTASVSCLLAQNLSASVLFKFWVLCLKRIDCRFGHQSDSGLQHRCERNPDVLSVNSPIGFFLLLIPYILRTLRMTGEYNYTMIDILIAVQSLAQTLEFCLDYLFLSQSGPWCSWYFQIYAGLLGGEYVFWQTFLGWSHRGVVYYSVVALFTLWLLRSLLLLDLLILSIVSEESTNMKQD